MTEQEAIKEFKDRLVMKGYRESMPEYYEAMELAVIALNNQKNMYDIDKLYLEKCQEVNKLKADRWIPCNEKMPGCEQEVLIQTERGTITTAMYEDGKMADEDSMWNWNEIDYDYDEETDTNYIPEGWWEYKHFAPDDVYNYEVDENVVAWQPLPPKYEPEEQDTGRVEAAKQMGFLK